MATYDTNSEAFEAQLIDIKATFDACNDKQTNILKYIGKDLQVSTKTTLISTQLISKNKALAIKSRREAMGENAETDPEKIRRRLELLEMVKMQNETELIADEFYNDLE